MDIAKILDFRSFLGGLIFSVTLLSIAGKNVSDTFAYDAPFLRFNEYLLRDTNFFSTAASMLNTTIQQSAPDQTLVLIGGNSILRGFGQGSSDIWSEKLQSLLGVNYKVFNFALPTGSPNMNAAIIGEVLHKKGRKVIIVTNSLYNTPSSDLLDNWDNYIFLEAYYKGLLDNEYRKDLKLESSSPSFDERRIAQALNSHLYFNDLWNFLSYRHFSTIWTSLTYWNWTGARAGFKDAEYQWNPRTKAAYDLSLNDDIRQLQNRIYCGAELCGPKINKEHLERRLNNMRLMMPDYLIKHTVVILSSENPYLVNAMNEDVRSKFNADYSLIENSWKHSGYTTLRIGMEIPFDEWNDAVHLGAPGGTRLATKLAPIIIGMNQELYAPPK